MHAHKAVMVAGAALLCASPALALASEPELADVYIEDVRYSGSGCPPDTLHVALSPDRAAFSLLFDAFTAEIGPGATGPRKRKCQVKLRMHVPRGWAYAVEAADFRGFAELDEGVVATQASYIHIAGGDRTAAIAMALVGVLWTDYLYQVVIDDADLAWSRCGKGKNLFIRTQVELDRADAAADASGAMVVDSADGRVVHDYRLRWQRCDT